MTRHLNEEQRTINFRKKTMFDHVGVNVKDLAASKKFYEEALKAIGYSVKMEWEGVAVGLGAERPVFWLGTADEAHPWSTGVHLCFAGESRAVVDQFYADAMAAGGKDNGAPGIRKDYSENYYAAFVYDLDGNNVEVVCHKPE